MSHPRAVVITGCSSGFARATALHLACQSWHVFAAVRTESDRAGLLLEAAAAAEGGAEPGPDDMTNVIGESVHES